MRTAAFVQARMGSTRLPGKSLMPVWGEMPLLELVLRRVSAAQEVDEVVLATSDGPGDDVLAALAARLGIAVHRGPELDALERFAGALERHPADAVVRVTADNPFVDPQSIDELVRFFRRAQPCDYAANLREESGLPDGSGAEIASADALRRAAREATRADDREHVTSFMYAGPGDFRTASAPPPDPPWPFVRLDVDTAEDLERMRSLAEALPPEHAPLWDVPTLMRQIERANALPETCK
jgi:spore coat polysaccharide biosynthesis protein SpsF